MPFRANPCWAEFHVIMTLPCWGTDTSSSAIISPSTALSPQSSLSIALCMGRETIPIPQDLPDAPFEPRAPNGSRLTCAAKRMLNCKQPKPITESVTTPMPQTRRQVQALVRAAPRLSWWWSLLPSTTEIVDRLHAPSQCGIAQLN